MRYHGKKPILNPATMKSITLLAILVGSSHAFSTNQHHRASLQITQPSSSATSTALYGIKRKGGRLGNNVAVDEDGNVKMITNKQKQNKLGSSKNKKGKRGGNNNGDDDATISPLLAEWAKEDSTSSSTAKPFTSDDESISNTKKRKSNKKSQQRSERATLSAEQSAQMDESLESINDMLETNNCDVSSLVSNIASMVDLNSSFSTDQVLLPTLKSILSSRPNPAKDDEKQPSYRLAWVGSDNGICHIGTSLHKVPLARLQEMYVLLGYNRWELLEVIRILGPFPNVRNTLKGELKVNRLNGVEREGVRMEISYSSMIDGLGKEILAGKEDNIKVVELDIWLANEKALVCTVPGVEGEDPLSGDGSNILFFVAEENLDEQLEKMRAA